jgi:sugar lactone lactonase YvrE
MTNLKTHLAVAALVAAASMSAALAGCTDSDETSVNGDDNSAGSTAAGSGGTTTGGTGGTSAGGTGGTTTGGKGGTSAGAGGSAAGSAGTGGAAAGSAGTGGAAAGSAGAGGQTTGGAAGAAGGAGGGAAGSAGGGAGQAGGASFLLPLDAAKGELPEGLTYDSVSGKLYAGLAATGEILSVDPSTGERAHYASAPAFEANSRFLLGLAFDKPGGTLFGGLATVNPAVTMPTGGIYRFSATGAATLFASDADMSFPNGLDFDDAGNLFVAESNHGTIYKITPAGTLTKWLSDPLLASPGTPCGGGAGFPLGANGIVHFGGAFYVANTDAATIVKIPIKADGSAGTATVFVAQDCAKIGGADGLAVDAAGSLYVAANGTNQITRVSPTGDLTVLASGAPFESPASDVIVNLGGKSTLFISNSSFTNAMTGQASHPGVLSLALP